MVVQRMESWLSLEGNTALITGATGHIGQNTAEALAINGCNLILLDRFKDKLAELQSALQADYPVLIETHYLDFENPDYINSLRDSHCKLERVGIFINNASFVGESKLSGWNVSFDQQSQETWDRCLQVSLQPAFALTQLLSKPLANHRGSIIIISSLYGHSVPDWTLYEGTNMGNPAAYAVSKAGLIQLTKWLAATLGPSIRVNCISPGGIFRNQPSNFVERYVKKTKLKRMASEVDISNAILFLASPRSAYITGHNLKVDGGWTL